MRRKFQIYPIVEAEIIPDISLELIKGGGINASCSNFSCGSYEGCRYFSCTLNNCGIFFNGKCTGNITCQQRFGNECQELVVIPDPCLTNIFE